MEKSCKQDISSLKALYLEGNYAQFIFEYEVFMDTNAYGDLTEKEKGELDNLYRLAKKELARKTKLALDDLNQVNLVQ
jgi:hypothetical protein